MDRLLEELRPKLHRYCARMTGSVIDGEDVLQDAFLKATESSAGWDAVDNPEGWLFRVAHNASIDFLRRRARRDGTHSAQDPNTIVDPYETADVRIAATASLRTFLRLPPAQRSAVILMDVLGYSLEEIGGITNLSLAATKAALHRARTRLREIAGEPDDLPAPILSEPERVLLSAYADRFNARDFDTIRDMLAEEVTLELVNRVRAGGKREVGNYVTNYGRVHDWHFRPGSVEGRPAILVFDPGGSQDWPEYFILLEWTGSYVGHIRDFRYARYAFAEARFAGSA